MPPAPASRRPARSARHRSREGRALVALLGSAVLLAAGAVLLLRGSPVREGPPGAGRGDPPAAAQPGAAAHGPVANGASPEAPAPPGGAHRRDAGLPADGDGGAAAARGDDAGGAPPAIPFTDVAVSAGLVFVHESGAAGEKLLPETMGGGGAFFDADGDGDPDVLLVNGRPWSPAAGGDVPTSALFLNDGRGGLTDATAGSGLDRPLVGMGCAIGDADGDGDPDVLLTALGPNVLLSNDGRARFADVTTQAGVAGGGDDWSTAAAFFDGDLDGDLDLFVGNYVTWSRALDLAAGPRLPQVGRVYGPPMAFDGAFPFLYRNDGAGTFADVSAAAGLHVVDAAGRPIAKTLGVLPVDADRDGLPDLFVANDTTPNQLFVNRGGLRFDERGAEAGVAFDRNGASTGAMGVDAGFPFGDDALALVVANFAGEPDSLYVALAPGLFSDEASSAGLAPATRAPLGFGVLFADLDLDGRPDVVQCNGHLDPDIGRAQPGQSYEQPAQLFWNTGAAGRGALVPLPPERTGDLALPRVGRGLSAADLDGDGDLDLLLTQLGRAPALLRNDQTTGHHWLAVRLAGTRDNRAALGAEVALVAGGRSQRALLTTSRGYLGHVDPTLTFGLGRHTEVTSLAVTWPDGSVQEVEVPGVDRLLVVEQR